LTPIQKTEDRSLSYYKHCYIFCALPAAGGNVAIYNLGIFV